MNNKDRKVALDVKNVSLSYRSKKTLFDAGVHLILNSISLKVYDGETLGVIGKNGCGKSTLLRLLAGILAPTQGEVVQAVGKTASLLALGLGFNPQLSGRDNAFLSAMLQGSSKKEAQSYLQQIRSFSELGDSFEDPVKTYSSGMSARLGFTTALMTKVDVLLIDEILSVGDAQFRAKAFNAMKERIGGDQTVVLVSHSDEQIKQLCDRVVWINNGKIEAQGCPQQTLRSYRQSIQTGNSVNDASSRVVR